MKVSREEEENTSTLRNIELHRPSNRPPSQEESDLVEDSSHTEATKDISPEETSNTANKGLPFYAIMLALCFAGLLTAMEATITSTALPSIVADLEGGDLYIWVVNGYLLSMWVAFVRKHSFQI